MEALGDARFGEVVGEARVVTRRYPGVVALDRASFSVRAGEVRALIGANGAGKSTLIRLLSGVEMPDEGEVLIAGEPLGNGGIREASGRGVATVYQELSLIPGLSVAENMFLGHWPRTATGIDIAAMRREAGAELGRLGVEIDPAIEVGRLTLADQQIVEIARAVHTRPRLLILDEPTSALASTEVSVVLRTVRTVAQSGVAVIYVSHRMDEIRQVADSVTVMRDGRVVDTVDIHGASTNHIVSLMVGDRHAETAAVARAAAGGDVLLRVHELSVPPKAESVSFEVRAGEVLGLAGLLGAGRTEVLRAIAGFDKRASGTIEIAGTRVARVTPRRMRQLGVGMTPENRKAQGIVAGLGVDENIVMSDYARVSRAAVLSASEIAQVASDLRERLAIKAANLSAPIGTLSGGNQQKAVIGRWLFAASRVLLLDEPTRGVDVEAKAQIYQIVREVAAAGAAVVFVSSELEELPLVCDRVLVMRAGRIAHEFVQPAIDLSDLIAATMAASGEEKKKP